ALFLDRIGVGEEGLQVLVRVQVAEGLDEGAGGQRRQGRGVVGRGAANGGRLWHGVEDSVGAAEAASFFAYPPQERAASAAPTKAARGSLSRPTSAAPPRAPRPAACP